MTDYAELKARAEAAKKHECGENIHTCPALTFEAYASPDVILALIAENERLRELIAERTGIAFSGEVREVHP